MSAGYENLKGRIAGTITNGTFAMPTHQWCRITNTSLAGTCTIQYYNANIASGTEILVGGEYITYSTEDCAWDKLDIIAPAGVTVKYVYQ